MTDGIRRLSRFTRDFLRTGIAGCCLVCLTLACDAHAAKNARETNGFVWDAGSGVSSLQAEAALQKGISLTREGQFSKAIQFLITARGHVKDNYAASFNLALCHVALGEFGPAVQILTDLRQNGRDTEDVNILLAQAYIGVGNFDQGLSCFKKAMSIAPRDERLYVFVADAFSAQHDYTHGLEIVNLGLMSLPSSARLHYQRGMMLTLQDEYAVGKKDFQMASELAPGSVIAYLAAAQQQFLEGNIEGTIRVARQAIKIGLNDYRLLSILGQALIRSGVAPGEQGFEEARGALEESVDKKSDYPASQVALGEVYLMENRIDDAIVHLEAGRRLSPNDKSVYTSLAVAYRRKGDLDKAQAVLSILEKMNEEEEMKIGTPSNGRRSGYGTVITIPPESHGKEQNH